MGTTFTFKAIRPKKLDVGSFRTALLNATEAEGMFQQRELRKTVASWQGARPGFDSLTSIKGGDLTVITGPTGSAEGVQKWTWLDEGTRPHVIRPRRAKRLRFQRGGFRAKTSVGKFESGAGKPASGPVIFSKGVRHPGTKARGWAALLSKRRQAPFRQRVFDAIDRAAKAAF